MAGSASASKAPTKKYGVLQHLRHNGKHYPVGAKSGVELTDDEAKVLLSRKVVGAYVAPAKAEPAASEKGAGG